MYAGAFPSLRSLIYSPWGYNGSKMGIEKGEMSFQMGVIHELLVIAATLLLIYLLKKKKLEKKALIIYFTSLLYLTLFLMQEVSLPIWKLITPMQFMEFPWRLLSVMALTSAFMIAFLINWLSNFNKTARFKIFIILIIVSALFYADRNIMRADKHYTWVNPIKYGGYLGTSDLIGEHLPTWHSKEEEILPYFPYEVLDGQATVKVESRKTNLHVFQINVDKKATIADRTDYFPGWLVLANGKKLDLLSPNSKMGHGLLAFELEPGEYKVESKLQEDSIEGMADGLSIASLLIFSILILREKLKLKI